MARLYRGSAFSPKVLGLVAARLLHVWQLPPMLVDAVAYHHDPLAADYGVDLPLLIGIADRLVRVAGDAAFAEARAVVPGLVAEGVGFVRSRPTSRTTRPSPR